MLMSAGYERIFASEPLRMSIVRLDSGKGENLSGPSRSKTVKYWHSAN